MSKNTKTVTKTETAPVESVVTSEKQNRILTDGIDIKKMYDELKTHSAVIRKLNADGYTRSEIANVLGKRYQHVRNVLVQDAQKAAQSK